MQELFNDALTAEEQFSLDSLETYAKKLCIGNGLKVINREHGIIEYRCNCGESLFQYTSSYPSEFSSTYLDALLKISNTYYHILSEWNDDMPGVKIVQRKHSSIRDSVAKEIENNKE